MAENRCPFGSRQDSSRNSRYDSGAEMSTPEPASTGSTSSTSNTPDTQPVCESSNTSTSEWTWQEVSFWNIPRHRHLLPPLLTQCLAHSLRYRLRVPPLCQQFSRRNLQPSPHKLVQLRLRPPPTARQKRYLRLVGGHGLLGASSSHKSTVN